MESLRVRDRIFYHKEVLNENCHPAVRCRRGIARGVICDCMRLWRPYHSILGRVEIIKPRRLRVRNIETHT